MDLSIDHVGVMVADLEQAKGFLGGVLGLEIAREAEPEELRLRAAFYHCGAAMIEAYALSPGSPFAPLVGGAIARIDHVAVLVPDIRAAAQELRASGVRTLDVGRGEEPLPLAGNLNLWTEPVSSGGVAYQLIEKGAGGHYFQE